MEQENNSFLEKFGREIAKIQEKHTRAALEEFLSLNSPKTNKQIATSEYYKDMSLEDVVSKICQKQIEGVLHDLFFIFEEDEGKKILFVCDDGSELNLATQYEELRSKPFEWVEKYSIFGWEGGRQAKFFSDYCGLGLA